MPETPANGGYMIAAYGLAGVVYFGYAALLWVRARRAGRTED